MSDTGLVLLYVLSVLSGLAAIFAGGLRFLHGTRFSNNREIHDLARSIQMSLRPEDSQYQRTLDLVVLLAERDATLGLPATRRNPPAGVASLVGHGQIELEGIHAALVSRLSEVEPRLRMAQGRHDTLSFEADRHEDELRRLHRLLADLEAEQLSVRSEKTVELTRLARAIHYVFLAVIAAMITLVLAPALEVLGFASDLQNAFFSIGVAVVAVIMSYVLGSWIAEAARRSSDAPLARSRVTRAIAASATIGLIVQSASIALLRAETSDDINLAVLLFLCQIAMLLVATVITYSLRVRENSLMTYALRRMRSTDRQLALTQRKLLNESRKVSELQRKRQEALVLSQQAARTVVSTTNELVDLYLRSRAKVNRDDEMLGDDATVTKLPHLVMPPWSEEDALLV